MTNAYVIGLSPRDLLVIQEAFDFDTCEFTITKIVHSINELAGASLIYGLDRAKDILKDIQERYEMIHVSSTIMLVNVIDGPDVDPMKLHIYEVNVGKEIELE